MRELHGVVQPAIGCEGIHLFEFAVRGVRYAGPDLSGASTDVVLLDFRFRRNAKFRHVYDMFCEWEHEIRVEERLAAAPRKRYPRCVGCAGAFPREPGPLLPRRPRRLISVERTRYPRFLGDPCVHAPLFDPGGPPNPGHYRSGNVVFRKLNDVDSAWDTFEALSRGLHALCVRFAAGVAPGPRNTRFRLVASLDRSGLSPAGSRRRFPSCLSVYMAFPLTKRCLAQ